MGVEQLHETDAAEDVPHQPAKNAVQDAPPDFNEQTHYVPVKTIITVSYHPA